MTEQNKRIRALKYKSSNRFCEINFPIEREKSTWNSVNSFAINRFSCCYFEILLSFGISINGAFETNNIK